MKKRLVITGMATFNPLGNTLSEFYENLMAGKSGIRKWVAQDTSRIALKIGGDISDRDWTGLKDAWIKKLDPDMAKRLRKLWKNAPYAVRLAMLVALEGFEHARLWGAMIDPFRLAVIVGGHNFNMRYVFDNYRQFQEEPEFIDPLLAMCGVDTDLGGSISELLQTTGPNYLIGGACASTNLALRDVCREIQEGDADVGLVIGAPYDVDLLDLQAMTIVNSVATSYNDRPEKASRPYDVDREGFVVSHGAGCLVVESLDHALARGATVHAEVLAVHANSSATHLPQPSTQSQERAMGDCMRKAGITPADVQFISAHATSTPLGDLRELEAIQSVFGDHAATVKINAPKSMLGHCCWAAPVVESIAAILQMNANRLHQSINIDRLDPAVRLDVCAQHPVDHEVTHVLKNSFGFGGVNCCSVYKKYTGPGSVLEASGRGNTGIRSVTT